jgi:hypothetical protein
MSDRIKRSRKPRIKSIRPSGTTRAYKAFVLEDGRHLEFTKEQWDGYIQRLYDARLAYSQKDWEELSGVVQMMKSLPKPASRYS